MLRPGVGRLTARPTAPITLVVAGRVGLAESLRAAPTCRFTDTGMRLPPMTRIAALPPMDVVLDVAFAGLGCYTPDIATPSTTSTGGNAAMRRLRLRPSASSANLDFITATTYS